jgi:hypothetical protein
VSIYNLSGKKVLDERFSAKTKGVYRLGCKAGLAPGMHLVFLQDGAQKVARKLAVVE